MVVPAYVEHHRLVCAQVLQRLGWNARVDYEIVRSDAALSCHSEHATILSFVGREVMQRCSASTGMPSSESATSSGLPNAHSQDLASLPYIFDRAVSVY